MIVAAHTMRKLPPSRRRAVHEHYDNVLIAYDVDFGQDIAIGPKYDPYWLSVTLADLGMPPDLGSKSAKWFYVTQHRSARWNMSEQSRKLIPQIGHDIRKKYGIKLRLNAILEDL